MFVFIFVFIIVEKQKTVRQKLYLTYGTAETI